MLFNGSVALTNLYSIYSLYVLEWICLEHTREKLSPSNLAMWSQKVKGFFTTDRKIAALGVQIL